MEKIIFLDFLKQEMARLEAERKQGKIIKETIREIVQKNQGITPTNRPPRAKIERV